MDPQFSSAVSSFPRINAANGFQEYTGGFNIQDQDYWVSLAWTAMPGVAIAILCLLIPLLYFLARCCCSICRKNVNCCPGPNPRGHSRSEVKLLKGVILFFTLFGLIGSVVLFGSAPKAASGVEKLTLDMVAQTDVLMNNFTTVIDAVDNAVTLLQGSDGDSGASNAQTQSLKSNLDSVRDSTEKFEKDVVNIFSQVKQILIIIAGALFGVALIIFLVNFFQVRFLLFLFIFLIPVFACVTWVAFGTTFLINAFIYDLCEASEIELQEPGHDGPLTQYIPCPDPASVDASFNEVYQQSNDLAFGMNQIASSGNELLAALGKEERLDSFCAPYYPESCQFEAVSDDIKQCPNRPSTYPSGTYLPTKDYSAGEQFGCPAGTLQFTTGTDFSSAWAPFKCEGSSDPDTLTPDCESDGKILTENQFKQLVDSASGISLLLASLEKLKSFAKCEFVDVTMAVISRNNCPSLMSDFTGMWVSFILVGISFMALFWLTIIGQARYRGLAQRNMETEMIARKSTQGSMDAGYLA